MAHRPRAPVVLTSFHKQGSLDTYLREVRTIRESRMLYPAKESRDDEQAGEEEGASAPTLHVRRVFRTDIMIILLDVLQESLHWHNAGASMSAPATQSGHMQQWSDAHYYLV